MKLTPEEIRIRGLVLAKHKDLLQLHRDLVMSGMVTEDEFWETRRPLLEAQQVLLSQKKAPSTSSLLGLDIRPQSDIQGDLKYILTPALIQSIFEQNPILKRAFTEKVPVVVDEKTFWMLYFTSKFFREGGIATSGEKNMLDEYYEESRMDEDDAVGPALKVDELPLSIDLVATNEDHFRAADPDAKPEDPKIERQKTATIRKINKISSNVLESGDSVVRRTESVDDLTDLLGNMDHSEFVPLNLPEFEMEKRQRYIIDEHHVDKLKAENFAPTVDPPLCLDYTDYTRRMADYRPASEDVEAPFQLDQLQAVRPEVYTTFVSNNIELLKQFWSAYPPGANKDKLEKATRMAIVLQQMLDKLDGWIASGSNAEKACLSKSMQHIRKSIELAIRLAQEAQSNQHSAKLQSTQKRTKVS